MKSLLDDIIKVLSETNFSIPIPIENISTDYPVFTPEFTKPYIYVSEINNTVHERTFTHKEEYSDLSYQIEIYSRQQKIDDTIVANNDVVRKIAYELDASLSSVLGLLRIGVPVDMPYGYDNTIKRYVLTYNGILDLTHDYIYRR